MPHTKDELPDALYCAAQVRALDARLIAAGTPGFELMQRAAHATWRALVRQWPDAQELTVLAGHGNNAGDGYLVAALAQRAGWAVQVLAVGEPQRLQGDAALAHAQALTENVAVQSWSAQSELRGVVLDALLGIGLSGDVREPYVGAIKQLNASGLPVAAVDIPSGLCADTGHVLGVAVRADLTVTFIGLENRPVHRRRGGSCRPITGVKRSAGQRRHLSTTFPSVARRLNDRLIFRGWRRVPRRRTRAASVICC
jgi:hydroxyethylthiazole kinase-like uncharacterized protein yjeF